MSRRKQPEIQSPGGNPATTPLLRGRARASASGSRKSLKNGADAGLKTPKAPARSRKPPASAPAAGTTEELLSQVRATAAKACVSLDACTDRVGEVLARPGEYDTQLASHLAYLSKHLVMLLGELRKLEVHDRKAPEQMTDAERDELIRSYLAEMPPERRAAILAQLDASTEESIL